MDGVCVAEVVAAELCGRGTHVSGDRCVADAGPDAFCGPGTIAAGAACVPSPDPAPWCGPGTTASGSACIPFADPTPWCGAGTRAQDGVCVYAGDASAFCGPGTVAVAGACTPAATPASYCGPGTVLAGDRCTVAVDAGAFCGPGTIAADGRCVAAIAAEDHCGAGTVLLAGICVPAIDPARLCGPGTSLEGGVCVASLDASRFCGPGTTLVAGVCSASVDAAMACGPGTTFDGTACIPSTSAADHCGAGTVLSGDVCIPARSDADHCGLGTHLSDARCVPDADPAPWCGPGTWPAGALCVAATAQGFELRLPVASAPADGFSRVPVLVLGPAGAAPQRVVLAPLRTGAGVFDRATLDVGASGASTFFVPCSASTAGCLGPVRIAAYLPTDLASPVAVSEPLDLVPPAGVGTVGPCLVADNVLFLDGQSYFLEGVETITLAEFFGSASPFLARFRVNPFDPVQGTFYMVGLGTSGLGVEMQEGAVYEDARSAWFPTAGHPGVDLLGDSSCNSLGRFQVHRLVLVEHVWLVEFLATFEIDCNPVNRPVRGCIRYAAP